MVAMNVWPTDAADGAVTSEARWRKMGRLWAPSGAAAGVGGELKPSWLNPNLTVKNGAAWADGHYCELTADTTFGGLTALSAGLVVVRFDPTANTAEILYLDGATTPTQNPTGTWEVPVAQLAAGVMTDLRTLIAPPGTTPWKNLTLQNGWVNIGSQWPPAQYRKVADSVQVRAMVASGTAGSTMFTLPTGFRPPYSIQHPSVTGAGVLGVTTLNPDGTVVASTGNNGSWMLNTQFSTIA